MRKLSFPFYILLFPACLLFQTACDPVSESDRYVEMASVEAQRTVLLEEFTGQNCPNCPTAHRTIEALQEQYGNSLISVSIHAGGFAIKEGEYAHLQEPYNFQTFMTPEGDTYANMLGVSTYPCGTVNRTGGVQLHTDWAKSIREAIATPSDLDIKIQASLGEDKIMADVELLAAKALEGKLQLWLVEDSVVSLQLDGGTMLTNYVHNNLYRASFNGVGGTGVTLAPNVYQKVSSELPLRKDWNSSHLSVVAFVYNQSGVCQACKAKL